MMLIEVLQRVKYNQRLYVYLANAYDQNLPIGKGVRQNLLDEEEFEEMLYNLTNPVDMISVAKDGTLVIRVTSDKENCRLEEQYNSNYVSKWGRFDKSTRPYLFSCELEEDILRR